MPNFNCFCLLVLVNYESLLNGCITFFCLTEDENLVFRGNSFATKAMDSYMKMIGESVSRQ